jgi:hypothetical protein
MFRRALLHPSSGRGLTSQDGKFSRRSTTAYQNICPNTPETHGNVVGWGTMLQAGRSRVRVPIKPLNFFSLTGSLWRRQSQQSFNTLTPFNFLFYSLHVSALRAILRWDIQVVIISVFWRTILIQRIRCTYAIWYRDVIFCHRYFNL